MPSDRKAFVEQRITYVTLSGIFLIIFAIFNLHKNRKGKEFNLRPFDLLLLGLSSYRMGRLIAYDKVMETYRSPFSQTVPDPTGAGDSVEPKGPGWRRAIGELICCPICSGTWVAAALVYGLSLAPRLTRTFMAIMSSIGLGELLNALTEALSWMGQEAREKSGAYARARSDVKAVPGA